MLRFFFCLMLYSLSTSAQKHLEPLTLTNPAMDQYLERKTPAVLTIRIINPPDSITKLSIKCTFVGFGPNLQTSKFYEFNRYGFARIVLDSRLPYQQIWLTINGYLYAGLYINDGLNISIDAKKIKQSDGFYMIGDGVIYSGIDGELNTLLNKYVVYKQDLTNSLGDQFYHLALTRKSYNENEFLSKFDSVYQAINVIANEFIAQYPASRLIIQNNLQAEYFRNLCLAYWGHKMPDNLFGKISSFSPYFTSNEGVLFYNYLFTYLITKKDNPAFNIDDHLYVNYARYGNEQRAVLDSLKYYSQLAGIETPASISKKRNELFFSELNTITNQFRLQVIDKHYEPPMSDILKTFLLNTGKNAFTQTYPEIINNIRTEWCRNIAMEEFKQATLRQKQVDSLLAKGNHLTTGDLYIGQPLTALTFNANLYRLDSIENLDDFIVNLKSKFANKALVIDFWATWCVPCLKELPVSKKLQESNQDLPIAFIYICTNSGSSLTTWKNKIADLKLPGTHIYASDKLVSELMRKFNSDGGFPTYVVIDAKGKLKPKAIEWMHTLDREKLKTAVGF